jgi:hypothetical protein
MIMRNIYFSEITFFKKQFYRKILSLKLLYSLWFASNQTKFDLNESMNCNLNLLSFETIC